MPRALRNTCHPRARTRYHAPPDTSSLSASCRSGSPRYAGSRIDVRERHVRQAPFQRYHRPRTLLEAPYHDVWVWHCMTSCLMLTRQRYRQSGANSLCAAVASWARHRLARPARRHVCASYAAYHRRHRHRRRRLSDHAPTQPSFSIHPSWAIECDAQCRRWISLSWAALLSGACESHHLVSLGTAWPDIRLQLPPW